MSDHYRSLCYSGPKDRHALPGEVATLWAKTGPDGQWHSLAAHMMDAVQMARGLWDEWLAPATRCWLAAPFADDEAGRAFFAWLAGCHDLGKASPAFQVQVSHLAERVRAGGLPLPAVLPERSKAPHAKVSAVAIGPLLSERFGWDRRFTVGAAAILGGHHGWFPEEGFPSDGRRRPSLYGWSTDPSDPWMAARAALFDLVVSVTDAERVLRSPNIELGRVRELALAGYVVLADWLASNADLFPYASVPFAPPYVEESSARANGALRSIGWHRWNAATTDLDFVRRFGFAPNALQQQMLVAARNAAEPGLFIVEAPMGMGKTEAAFGAVEVLAAHHGLGGTFIALPTQATSNQMFSRARQWLTHFTTGTYVMELAHGKAGQVDEYRELSGKLTGIDIDGDASAVVTAEAWFHGPKRRLLAPFVVGTVDQVLVCVAKVRHVALRQVGLQGKVVVVDEVHAYDAHMSVFLRRALRWLGAAHVPVILLSATLPAKTRTRLIESYLGSPIEVEAGYPSVTHVALSGDIASLPVTLPTTPRRARLQVMTEAGREDEEVANAVAGLVRRGANVLVVRNTVLRAQATFRVLAEALGEDVVTLLHARFLVEHRLEKETWLAACFGPGGERPHGHVVVGTQVLEQSLDVDFDVLVTDLAPIDLVLQRAGRVHRFPSIVRAEGFEDPLLIVVGMARTPTGPPVFPRGSLSVYEEHLLLRSAAVVLERESIVVPDEVPLLVEQVYGDHDVVPSTWSERAKDASREWRAAERARESTAEQFAIPSPEGLASLLELCRIGIGDPDDDDPVVQAAVRDMAPTVEVVVGWESSTVDSIDCAGGTVPLNHCPEPNEVGLALSSTLRLPPWLTSAALGALQVPTGWQEHPWLRHLRVLRFGPANEVSIGKNVLRYTKTLGLEVTGSVRPG